MRDIGTIAEGFAAGTAALRAVHEGPPLLAAAKSVLDQLPEGPVEVYAASVEGAVLAGMCAALRADGSRWERVHLMGPLRSVPGRPVVFVEPVEPGKAWRAAVQARYPAALVLLPQAAEVQVTDCRPAKAAAAA